MAGDRFNMLAPVRTAPPPIKTIPTGSALGKPWLFGAEPFARSISAAARTAVVGSPLVLRLFALGFSWALTLVRTSLRRPGWAQQWHLASGRLFGPASFWLWLSRLFSLSLSGRSLVSAQPCRPLPGERPENPHCGNCAVPFINSTTGCSVTVSRMKFSTSLIVVSMTSK